MHQFKTILLLALFSVLVGCAPRVSTPICPVYEYGPGRDFKITILPPAAWVGIHAALKKASQSPQGAFAIQKRNVFYLFPEVDSRNCLVLVPDGTDSNMYTGIISWNGPMPKLDQDSQDSH
jgi:hypothetical protein